MTFEKIRSAKLWLAVLMICLSGWSLRAASAESAAAKPQPSKPTPALVIPPEVYAVCGRECNLYFDNLFPGNSDGYHIDINTSGNLGAQQNERFTIVPAEPAESVLTINIFDGRTGEMLTGGKTRLHIASHDAHSGSNIKVMLLGDSLINAGIIGQSLLDIAKGDPMKITLAGTRGTAPNLHEGRGGWKISDYTSDRPDNPFWINGRLDFSSYLNLNDMPPPDWVFIELGTNDIFHKNSDAEAAEAAIAELAKLDLLISSIKAAGSDLKIGLMIAPPPAASQDAFGANYGTGQTRARFKRNILIWAAAMIEKYAGREAEAIYLVPGNTALDTANNMIMAEARPVNSRSAATVSRQDNGVHPAAEGYRQIADALWAFLKNAPAPGASAL